ncbi:synaptosomal-associated protein 29-like [Corticium candelabrum]|uniref:synaptosomal-associated protein 29-like n=1 Tax=Corticium candelabrum TaxID=121492 RepID=UPI002E26316E|nr:synaptosomal-associated protein 29-like [Corticium candelabrum]
MAGRSRAEMQLLKEERERRMQESSERCLGLVENCLHVGTATATELYTQGETLNRTEQKLDDIEEDLKTTSHHLRGIRSVFASLFSRSPKTEKENDRMVSKEVPVERLDTDLMRQKANDLAWDASSSGCEDAVDRNLVGVQRGLEHAKVLALELGNELDRQNSQVERIAEKTDKVNDQIIGQDIQIKKILRK